MLFSTFNSYIIEPGSVNELLGYVGSFWPQGLWRVGDDRPTDRVVRRIVI